MLGDTAASVECNGVSHRLGWQAGRLIPFDHADPEREAAVAALGGDSHECLALVAAWQRHVDDLDVLLLASRGSGDQLAPPDFEAELFHRHHPGGHRRRGGMWFAHGPNAPTDRPEARPVTLERLLQLPGGLPRRLVEQVVVTWTERWQAGAAAPALPRLHAALHGRFAAALRDWLGEPLVRIDVDVVHAGAPVEIARHDTGVRAAVPFTWLSETWLPGLAVVLDRFCLATDASEPGRYDLITIDRTLGDRRAVTIAT